MLRICIPNPEDELDVLRALLLGACFGCLAPGVHAQIPAERPIHLVRFPKSANQFVASQLVEEIYKRSGLTVTIETMPPKRASVEAREGHIDGEVSRVENYFLENPDLIRVTPAYSAITITAFSNKPVQIASKEDLAKYRVGIVRGVQTSMDLTEGLANVEQAIHSKSLFAMLGADHIDVAIDVNVNGQFEMQSLGLKNVRDAATLLRTDVFTVLSPANARLVDRLSKTIAQLKRTGELDRLKSKLELDFVRKGIRPD